jgi:ferredoxin, 2Fe-2S
MRSKIHLTYIENNSKHPITTHVGEYNNLMFMLRDKFYLDAFGECGGMGRCATCIIKINGLTGKSTTKEGNEPVTLSKIGFVDESIRLSCQLMVTKDLNNTEIELIEL